jgi:Flp pilus assembly protein TadG
MRLARIGRRGWVAAEFALIAPAFFLIALGTADLIRLFRAQLRTETIAVQIGQIVSQCTRITTPGDVNQFWAHANRIAGGIVDISSPTGGAVVISAVGRNTATNPASNRLAWQIRTGNTSFVPSVGTTQGRPLRNGLSVLVIADSLRGSAKVARRRWVSGGSDRAAWRRRCCRRVPAPIVGWTALPA